MENELGKMSTREELIAMREVYKTNPSALAIINGAIEARDREEAEAKAQARFASEIAKLFGKLPHPESILNVYARWAEVTEVVAGSEPEAVELVVDGIKHTEMRQPTIKAMRWVVETNKGFSVDKANTGGANGKVAHKLAVTVSKRSEANSSQLVLVGHFPSGQKGADYLHIPTGVESANKVLRDRGYFVEPYKGTDYTS